MRKQNDQLEFPLIDEIFNRPNITREEAITEAMDLVTEFTNYATIALGKTASNSRIKKLEFISLNNNQAVILMVTDQGHVESKRILVPKGISVREIEKQLLFWMMFYIIVLLVILKIIYQKLTILKC